MDPSSALELSAQEEEQVNISFDCIDWAKFKQFDWKKNFVHYTGLSKDTLKSLPADRLKQLQCTYYMQMLAKDSQKLFFDGPPQPRDQYVAIESRERAAEIAFSLIE